MRVNPEKRSWEKEKELVRIEKISMTFDVCISLALIMTNRISSPRDRNRLDPGRSSNHSVQ